jgi:hypothetical protein
MKNLLMLLSLMLSGLWGYSQGTVNFANGAAGVDARIYTYTGWLGPDWAADLYYGAQGSSQFSLIAGGFNVPFSSGESAGYFFGGSRTLNGFAAGSTITVQVRVWRPSDAATFEEAARSSGGHFGTSYLIDVTLGGGVTPPPNLIGLQGFYAGPLTPPTIPEPSTFALGILGVGAFFLIRRSRV